MAVPQIKNLLTGETLRVFPEVAEPAQPPTMTVGDVAFYRQPQVTAWGTIRVVRPDPLVTELQFLEGLGYAVGRDDGQWYVDLVAKERLYGHNGLFVVEADQERKMVELARMFATDVLPAYAAMTAGVSQTLPRTTFQGIVAREQARDIAAGIRELRTRFQIGEREEGEDSNASSVSSEDSNTNSNASSVSREDSNTNTDINTNSNASCVRSA